VDHTADLGGEAIHFAFADGAEADRDDGQAAEITAPSINHSSSTAPPLSTDGMHPSWVAKQKFKPKIAAFQGTKIKFDDE